MYKNPRDWFFGLVLWTMWFLDEEKLEELVTQRVLFVSLRAYAEDVETFKHASAILSMRADVLFLARPDFEAFVERTRNHFLKTLEPLVPPVFWFDPTLQDRIALKVKRRLDHRVKHYLLGTIPNLLISEDSN